jgi:hypothetical protein
MTDGETQYDHRRIIMSGLDSVSNVGESPSGTESFSIDLGEGSLTINVSANATARADADGESSAESTSEEQSLKDMEGMERDYSAQGPESADTGETGETDGGEEAGEAVDPEIDELKEGITDGLIAIEEFEPGFVEELMSRIEGAEGETDKGVDAADSTQGEDAAQDPGADPDSAIGRSEELLASLEELVVILEEIIGMLGGGEPEKPGVVEGVADSDKDPAVASDKDSGAAYDVDDGANGANVEDGKEVVEEVDKEVGKEVDEEVGIEAAKKTDPDTEEVAEGMAEELGDGKVPEAAESNPVDTFMEIFEQMSPDAQAEVVEILASGVFGQEGIEAADAINDGVTGKSYNSTAVDEVEA